MNPGNIRGSNMQPGGMNPGMRGSNMGPPPGMPGGPPPNMMGGGDPY
jgi:hypothetical protein